MIQFVIWVMAILLAVCVNAIQDGECNILSGMCLHSYVTQYHTMYHVLSYATISGLVIGVSVAQTMSHHL